jgi:hypothetical protein
MQVLLIIYTPQRMPSGDNNYTLPDAIFSLALVLDVAVILRILFAYLHREQGRGWLIYVRLLYTSPIWLLLLAKMIVG